MKEALMAEVDRESDLRRIEAEERKVKDVAEAATRAAEQSKTTQEQARRGQ